MTIHGPKSVFINREELDPSFPPMAYGCLCTTKAVESSKGRPHSPQRLKCLHLALYTKTFSDELVLSCVFDPMIKTKCCIYYSKFIL